MSNQLCEEGGKTRRENNATEQALQTFLREENAERERERNSPGRLARKGREKSRMLHSVGRLPFLRKEIAKARLIK